MPNGQPVNPFTAPLSMVKQLGEQGNVAIQSLGTSMTQTASQVLDTLMGAAPPLPGAAPGRAPTAAAGLLPANLQQALGQVETLLPPGLPRPSQMMGAPAPPPPLAAPPAAPPANNNQPAPQQGTAATGRRKVLERRGI